MKNSERCWINAAIHLLLSNMLNGESLISLAAMIICYLLSVGYFCAMVWSQFKERAK